MNSKKGKIITIVSIIVLVALFAGFTYAFFEDDGLQENISATSNTTDTLTFQVDQGIAFTASRSDYERNGSNKSGTSNVTAVLTPNNKTGAVTMTYNMYLDITENTTVYSTANTNQDPEVMLQVFDGNNNLVTLTGLGTQKTIKGVVGYDITGRQGLLALLENHEISASNNTSTAENWRVVVTLINLDVNQIENSSASISGRVLVKKNVELESPRLANVVPQSCSGTDCGVVETVVETTTNQNNDIIYDVYSVGYITDETSSGVTYSFDIENMNIDLSTYKLVLDGTPAVMASADYTIYMNKKGQGSTMTNSTTNNADKINATSSEMATYALDSNELSIDSLTINCTSTKCTITVTESFSNISSKTKQSTTTNDNTAVSVLYNGIKFNLKKMEKTVDTCDNCKYWNDNYSYEFYDSTSMPSGTGLHGVFDSRELLEIAINTAYSNNDIEYSFDSEPYYIRTRIINGIPSGHDACYYHAETDREFCFSPNYWTGTTCYDGSCHSSIEGENTKAKLKADIEEKLGIILYNSSSEAINADHSGYYCESDDMYAICHIGSFACSASDEGDVNCFGNAGCGVYGSVQAFCSP